MFFWSTVIYNETLDSLARNTPPKRALLSKKKLRVKYTIEFREIITVT